jgi:hypothetical protein
MLIVAVLLAVLALGAGAAGLAGLAPGPLAAHAEAALGLGAGLLAGAIAGRAAAHRREAPRPGEGAIYEAKGSTCPLCRRPLLPGTQRCPFCHPLALPTAGERTLDADYRPLVDPVAMPGLAAAAKLKREAGARGFLHVFEGGNKGQSVLLGAAPVTIGRAPQNTLILTDNGVSQSHAEVRPHGKGYLLRDLASKNGTFVNDQRIAEAALRTGDVIAVGETKMLVNID